jgi:hypothetical protein
MQEPNQLGRFDICVFCDEPVTLMDRLAPGYVNGKVHWECGLRQVVGGVNHQRQTCSCCGGTDLPDPPGMTPREAAKAAAFAWMLRDRKEY